MHAGAARVQNLQEHTMSVSFIVMAKIWLTCGRVSVVIDILTECHKESLCPEVNSHVISSGNYQAV